MVIRIYKKYQEIKKWLNFNLKWKSNKNYEKNV